MINLPLAYYLLMSAGILCEQSNFLTLAFQGEQFWKSAGLTCVWFTCHSERGLWSSSWIKPFKIWGFELQICFCFFFYSNSGFLSIASGVSFLVRFLSLPVNPVSKNALEGFYSCFINLFYLLSHSPLFPTTIPVSKCSKCWFLCSRLPLSF